MTAPARVAGGARIANLDVLRGLAILFILLLNMPYVAGYAMLDFRDPRIPSWTEADQTAWWIVRFLDGTQRGLLELLFGAGVIIMTRVGAPVADQTGVLALHLRRNLWLMAFGLFHGVVLLWPGDILLSYGVAALLVFPFRKLSPRWLGVIGLALTLAGQFAFVGNHLERVQLAAQLDAGDDRAAQVWRDKSERYTVPDRETMAIERAGRLGDFAENAAFQIEGWRIVQFKDPGIFFLNIYEAFATMLIGAALWKRGLLQGRAPPSTYAWLALGGYGLGLALRTVANLDELRFDAGPRAGDVTGELSRLLIVFGHVAAVNLALTTALGRRLLQPFEATGRMPLTTYMGASIVCGVLFAGWGFGLWGRYGYAGFETIALAIIAAQLIGANLWLRAFATGPLEWLWKSLAYRRSQPFRRRGPMIGTEATA